MMDKLGGGGGQTHSHLYWETYNHGPQSIRTPNGYLHQEAALIEGDRKVIRVSEEASGTYVLAYDRSRGEPIETVESSIANGLDSCGWLRGITERLDQAHQNASDGALEPLGARCQIIGGQGADIIMGGDSDEKIVGRAGADELEGMNGDDQIYGGPDNDYINGNMGNDYVNENTGNDTLHGGKGDDVVRGGKNDDYIYGDLGNDILYGDKGIDFVFGGDGDDLYMYEYLHDQLTIYPDSSGNDELRCVNARATGERTEGNDLTFDMLVGGQIRLADHVNNQIIERVTDCRP